MTERKIDLIAQLLRKAESTTPEEAEALTAAAERLMAKYMIDQATIDERRAREGKEREQIIQSPIMFEGTYSAALLDLGSAVMYGLGTLRPLQSVRGNRRVLYVVGYQSDVEQAEVLINSLVLQGMVAMRSWWAENRDGYEGWAESVKRQARIQFLRYFGYGAGQRIEENRQKAVEEMSSGTDLVLVSRKSRVDEYVDGMNLRKSKAGTTKSRHDGYASGAGARAGRNANTGEKAMTQGRGLPAGSGR